MSSVAVAVVDGLTVQGRRGDSWATVVDHVSLAIRPGETVGLVGESGSGKSTIAYAMFGYARQGMRITGGTVSVCGSDVLAERRRELRAIRGRRLGLVPQNPATSLTPSKRVGRQLIEMLRVHRMCRSRTETVERAHSLLDEVGLPEPATLARRYPHQLSGGQIQRVGIALALACEPELLVLDEPTTALDVTSQAHVLRVLAKAKAVHGVGMLYVTHDLGVLGQICDQVVVMHAGEIVEIAPTQELFTAPRHPYTRTLIGALPGYEHLDPGDPHQRAPGDLVVQPEAGCGFATRCPFVEPACTTARQRLAPVAAGHAVACRRWQELGPTDSGTGRKSREARA